MPRKARLIVDGDTAVYHIISRTALDGFPLGDTEKDYMLQVIRYLSSVYFAEILGFCIMGNHIHVVIRMHAGHEFSDRQIKARFARYCGHDKGIAPGRIPVLREKWSSLSEFVKEREHSLFVQSL